MLIFDRYDNVIFHCSVNDFSQSLPCRWDGTVKGGSGVGSSGNPAQQETYIWRVNLKNIFNKSQSYTGRVSVIR